ncbi:hypothetical protein ACFY1J_37755 [Streptomyces sp. NPDC001406]|uniref:hypothetical protein n=1 Tax=Streptomyces sp. NPDC001406 TaxID=3364572 RepID=UPI0036C0E34D
MKKKRCDLQRRAGGVAERVARMNSVTAWVGLIGTLLAILVGLFSSAGPVAVNVRVDSPVVIIDNQFTLKRESVILDVSQKRGG